MFSLLRRLSLLIEMSSSALLTLFYDVCGSERSSLKSVLIKLMMSSFRYFTGGRKESENLEIHLYFCTSVSIVLNSGFLLKCLKRGIL